MDCTTASEIAAGAQHIVICATFRPALWTLLPSILTPVIALAALYFAWQNIRNARDIARHKATLDLIEKKESTDYYRSINEAFSRLRRGRGFEHLNDPASDEDKADRAAIIDYLNHYEMVSIGILEKLLDERLYRAWMQGAFVRDWNAAAPWIQRERWKHDDHGWSYRASILANYQRIAERWSAEAQLLSAATSGPPAQPSSRADEPLPEPVADPIVAVPSLDG